MHTIVIKPKVLKRLHLLPDRVRQRLALLLEDLRDKGPIRDDSDTDLDVFKTQWYRFVKDSIMPGDYLRSHRERMQWTQAQLGSHLGDIPRQHISNMETGKRSISLKMAKALAEVFGADFSIFIQIKR